ncbi:Cell surface protein [Oopsacas minuta]|uniref:Cell surface protein n=1 Tax=Oopsacas minuta TaxID=111878 RepID=A0AAV7KK72_9METZ|nr:Cell surface protein [Oopsacas minuta]
MATANPPREKENRRDNFELELKSKTFSEVNKLGELAEKMRGIDYTSKKQPLASICKERIGDGQLGTPLGITVDNQMGNIYLADQCNHCVKVFDSTAKYLFRFGDSNDDGNMSYPKCLAICRNRVLISQDNHCIMNYQLDGKFVSKIGKLGNGELEFNYPWGITIDESNGDVYICDYSNNRIQILSENLHFKSKFARDTKPIDIKLNKDKIFILDASNPCLHIFDKDLILQKNIISRGEGQQVIFPSFFFLDNSGNILITDYGSDSILIFNSEYECIHKISISYPTGITVDYNGRIIVASCASMSCLQIF